MKPTLKKSVEVFGIGVAVAIVLGVIALTFFIGGGVSARPQPGRVETFVARTVRDLAIAWHAPRAENPVPQTQDAVADGRAHFADHCASCHGNDGRGETEAGRGLYPRAPDMRLPATQNLSDAQLFYIIENGIRLTGMPGWSTGTPDGERSSWQLVHFIRHLPTLTAAELEEMAAMNPRPPGEIRGEIEAERFLQGGGADVPAPPPAHGEHK